MMNLILRILWFYLAGLWLGGLWLAIAWLFCVSVIGIPVGVWMINRAPAIFTLKESGSWEEISVGDKTAYYFDQMEQPPFLIRAIYFLLIGWWLSFFWTKIALLLAATFIGMPVSFWMINRLPYVVSLHRG
jgi:uncharacterized membrane protein YccF (DUF307 family)